jgi:hypothetical protein
MSVAGTIFEPVAQHLTAQGVPVSTIGGVADALDMSDKDAHDFGCYCNHAQISGELAADYLRGLAMD